MKRIILLALCLLPTLVFSQKKISARSGKANQKVSKGKTQREDRKKEVKKDEEVSWDRTTNIQDKKTKRRMEKKRKKARKIAIRRANRNKKKR